MFLVPDIYSKDLGALPNFAALAADSRVVGCTLKATEGTHYAPDWFIQNWNRARVAGVRGAYHYGRPTSSGAAQADFFLGHVERAGGFTSSDMAPSWDLEEGAGWSSPQQIIDVSSGFAARVRERTGKDAILYTGMTVRDRSITDHMGFGKLWTPHLDMSKAGWSLSQYALWQYAGDGKLYNPASAAYGLPTSIPGWGATDMSVVMENGSFVSSADRARDVLTSGLGLASFLLLGAAATLAYLLWRT